MNLATLSEQILRLYHGGDIPDENGLQQQDIKILVAQVSSYLVEANLYNNMKIDGRSVDPLFIATYEDVAVLYNTKRNRYYITLPSKPISLNHGLGTYQISPMQGEYDPFIPLYPGWMSQNKEGETSFLEGNVGFEPEGNRVMLVNFDQHKQYVTTVLVKMVQNLADFDEDEELPIPPNYEFEIVTRVLNLLKPRHSPDNINDNKELA